MTIRRGREIVLSSVANSNRMTPLQDFGAKFDPSTLRESRSVEMKLLVDKESCSLPGSDRTPGCSHDVCRHLRNAELGADFSQFANADGGVIVFGVRVTGGVPRIEGIADVDGTRLHVENVIKAVCSPVPLFESAQLAHDGKALLAFYIAPSTLPVWVKGPRDSLKLVRRLDATKMALDGQQATEFVNDMSRSAQIRINRIFADTQGSGPPAVELAGGIVQFMDDVIGNGGGWGGGGEPPSYLRIEFTNVQLTRCEAEEFHLQFWEVDGGGSPALHLPYSSIKHVWRTADARVGLVLNVALTLEGGANRRPMSVSDAASP